VPAFPEAGFVAVGEIQFPDAIPRCPHCDVATHPDQRAIQIVNINQEKDGWRAHGRLFTCRCPSCGTMLSAIMASVPVECAEYQCPRCGPESILRTDVLSLTSQGGYYDFEAMLRCPKCRGRRRFRQRLSAPFRSLRRLKLGPTGVEIEMHEPRPSDDSARE
jgi:hypothetical protein